MRTYAIICGLAVCIAPNVVLAQSVLDFPAGAIQKFQSVNDASSYLLPLSGFSNGAIKTERTEGHIVQQVWRTINDQTETLTLLSPLRTQLESAGYEILFECETRGCGGFDFRFNTKVIDEPEMHVDLGDFRFLSAKKMTDDIPDYIGLLVSKSAERGYIQVTRVGEKPWDQPAVVISTKQPSALDTENVKPVGLTALLLQNGTAPLEGLVFENGASGLDSTSGDVLKELALFLDDNPQQSAVLVGHTDASGSLSGNVALSRKRADSVMKELVATFGISPDRLTAEGIGYLAPRASNETEVGRQKNRRVEVVLTLSE